MKNPAGPKPRASQTADDGTKLYYCPDCEAWLPVGMFYARKCTSTYCKAHQIARVRKSREDRKKAEEQLRLDMKWSERIYRMFGIIKPVIISKVEE